MMGVEMNNELVGIFRSPQLRSVFERCLVLCHMVCNRCCEGIVEMMVVWQTTVMGQFISPTDYFQHLIPKHHH